MKRFIALILAIFTLMQCFVVAATKEEQLKNTKSNISNTQSKIKQNEAEQKNVRNQINSIDNSINSTEDDIEATKSKIETVEANIKDTEEDIRISQAEYDKNYELRKQRMVAYYKAGSVSLEESITEIEDEPDRMYLEKAIEKV